jgi:hypothetical protein
VTDKMLINAFSRDAQRKENYLSRHWRGELSLPVAFWVNYVGVEAIYFPIGKIMESNEVGDSVGIPFMLTLLPITIWQCVGTWRSAGNRGGFWSVAVRVCVAVGILEAVVGYTILIT